MAAEDLSDPTALPPYPEMIVSAIEALNEKNGSNKSSITKQIESIHGPIPSTLLSHHLTEMQQSGRLSLLNNNYLVLPDSTSPPKRGRGRPPKPKSAISTPSGPPRPRGRPPKTDTVSASADTVSVSASGGTGRGRGRPPKKAKIVGGDVSGGSGVKRGRGRPPKVKVAEVGA